MLRDMNFYCFGCPENRSGQYLTCLKPRVMTLKQLDICDYYLSTINPGIGCHDICRSGLDKVSVSARALVSRTIFKEEEENRNSHRHTRY